MRIFLFSILLIVNSIFAQDVANHVNPFIGTGGHGHTFPGATVPYGMVQLSPDTRIDGSWDGCSGYHYSDAVIYGFSHTHLNGTGVSDYGDMMLMPTMGEPSFDHKVYSSSFSHTNEKASAGFYSVKLDKHNIDVRLTTSTRVGFHEYTFNKAGQANIILDLNHRDKLLEGRIRVIDNKTIEVLRRSEAWAQNQYVFARIEFNVPMIINKEKTRYKSDGKIYEGVELALSFSKQVKKGEKILIKVSLSPTSYEGAELNSSEIKHWDFEKAHQDAVALWNNELSKIEITSKDKDKLAIFYTALYHTMMQPNIAQDLDGKYRGRDNQIHQAEGFDYYTVFSLWDTFRAAHPLYTLIDKKRTSDYINTFIKQYEQGGRLPVWELASNETDCMIGYHSVSVIADAMAKGIKGFDYEKAFEASKASAMRDVLGLEAYKNNGFIAIDDEHESVSKTVEYAYDDWCIAQMAMLLDKQDDYQYFMKRSQNWKNIFDWEIGFIRPKKNGGWDVPFDPKEINNNFTEGNGWQYTFFVPQDIHGMIEAYGGPSIFEAKLDEMFNSESKTTGREQVDVTGLIGQYAHGNEPSHHMAYLYNYIGKPQKTNEKVTYILDNFYKNTPDGLIGNEDCGQMSAWYVLSSMGIYQVTPGQQYFNTCKSTYPNAKIRINENKIVVPNTDESENKFVNYNLNYFLKGPDTLVAPPDGLVSIFPTVPVIVAKSKSFKEELPIQFKTWNKRAKVFYSINQSTFTHYQKPFTLKESATIHFYSDDEKGNRSDTITAQYFKKPNNYTIDIKSEYNPQYHAGGPEGLIDGIFGSVNWRKGDWQGYQNKDFEAVIDLKKKTKIETVSVDFLQDTRAWILMPTQVELYVSDDNVNFEKIAVVKNTLDPKDYEVQTQKLTTKVSAKARYVKVIARNFGKLPVWHQGYPFDGFAFIFIDEIEVN
ncbi:alpha-mannosidase [Flavobacterium sediminis]|uniref:Alpha-mannosidase n=1 Tax=Flavobacterium sediminis TaxID=2201181 RepID=A0A2U8QTM7_9FLAO|nr:GH92 family glycosyl hydrolase [Flavobacterium sediminis]AWM13537.1 alpha-mannosidase [Flavobacterium sediminis]